MPKLFVCSDIHSFYTPLKKALDDKGFDPNNEDHWLIVCGDVFDRGDESEDVLDFLLSLNRKVLVKGNHDTLLFECCKRKYFYSYDIHNGTCDTIYDLGGAGLGNTFNECCQVTLEKLAPYKKILVNYFETQNYIFVHSWIPMVSQDCEGDWRNASQEQWDNAMWGNPFDIAEQGPELEKTIVFGHFHTSYQWNKISNCSEFGEDANFQPYYGNKYIGIDACTAHTGKCNVIVLEDDFIKK